MASNVPSSVSVLVHPSRFPTAVETALVASLDARRMDHQFHYDSPKQARRWLRIHKAFSPARRDDSTREAYRWAAVAAGEALAGAERVDVLSLGCGGGQKDRLILEALLRANPAPETVYFPTDVSVGLALEARAAAMQSGLEAARCRPWTLDLGAVEDWSTAFGEIATPGARRIVAFFGMMPNFAPRRVLRRLADLLGPEDRLLVSANLAPGADYAAGVRSILPLYENAPTAEWLQTVLLDLGAERGDGRVQFRIAECPEGTGLLRIEANYVFERSCVLSVAGREWRFEPGERFGLFYSYRHTPERVAELFGEMGLNVTEQWLNTAGDEGVFLLKRGSGW